MSEFTTLDFESVNTPAPSPVLVMSTVPLAELAGLEAGDVEDRAGAFELECDMVPAVTMLPALAEVEVKLAPEATAIMAQATGRRAR